MIAFTTMVEECQISQKNKGHRWIIINYYFFLIIEKNEKPISKEKHRSGTLCLNDDSWAHRRIIIFKNNNKIQIYRDRNWDNERIK